MTSVFCASTCMVRGSKQVMVKIVAWHRTRSPPRHAPLRPPSTLHDSRRHASSAVAHVLPNVEVYQPFAREVYRVCSRAQRLVFAQQSRSPHSLSAGSGRFSDEKPECCVVKLQSQETSHASVKDNGRNQSAVARLVDMNLRRCHAHPRALPPPLWGISPYLHTYMWCWIWEVVVHRRLSSAGRPKQESRKIAELDLTAAAEAERKSHPLGAKGNACG